MTGVSVAAAEGAPQPSGSRTGPRWLPWLLALLTLGLAAALPLAPIVVDTPEVRWPADPDDPRSTTALFMPYRPIDLAVAVPCATLASVADRQESSDVAVVLGTALPDSGRGRDRSLFVSVADGSVRVLSSGRELWSGPVPTGSGCRLTVQADQSGSRVSTASDGAAETVLADVPGAPVPEVVAFTTDVVPADGAAPTVVAHPDARFQSSPTPVKIALLVAHLAALAGCLWLLSRSVPAAARPRDGPDPDRNPLPGSPASARGRWRLVAGLADAVVVLTLVGWTVIAPIQTDDFYYSLEARTLDSAGFVGNQVRYFDVPEVPFVLTQLLLAPLAHLSAAPLVLRLPSLLAGLAVWWLLTRRLVPLLVERPHPALRGVAGIALLAWWLPWNTSTRPEAFVALAWTVTLVLALEAIRRRRPLLVGLAAVVAGLAVTVTASGLACAATLVVLLPRLWPVLAASRWGVWATSALVVACGSIPVAVVFADSSLASALAALRVHREVGPQTPWWTEPIRYWYLMLGNDPNQRNFARQVVVLTTLAVVVGLSIALLRVTRRASGRISWAVPALAFLAVNAALVPTPTKWSHHFGALAGAGALALTVGVAVLVRRRPDRWASVVLLAAVAVTAAVGFHGGNDQVEYSAYGVDRVLPAVLGNPALWLAAGLAVSAAVTFRRRRRAAGADRVAWRWPEAVVGALGAVLVTSLVIQVGSATLANWRLRDTWSMAGDAVDTLTGGGSCGFADSAVALTGAERLDPLGGDAPPPAAGTLPPGLDGDRLDGTAPAGVSVLSTWQASPADPAVTEVATPWRETAGLTERDVLAVTVAGVPGPGTQAVVDLAAAVPGGEPRVLESRPVDLPAAGGAPEWNRVLLGPAVELPAGTDLVRLRLVDADDALGVGDPGQRWLAGTEPYRMVGRTLSDLLPEDEPVVVDWPLGFAMPCQEPPRIADGMVEPVEWLVQSITFADTPPLTVIDGGGSYSTAPEVSDVTTYVGFTPGVSPYTTWGNLVHWDPRLAQDGYELVHDTRVVGGWGWWPGAGPGPSPD
ncbi:arabinosyltransferase domain-containing protein [Blastococcus sp. URHD0036]|uniref:arabinosyltransferase domain-containing protein n=1 Tax=Blastococcus sp. URHD0036 TaxID=1380356 RepID=UPI000495FEEB|nr:arabinosyltransferase domain-containing protein [Blastococcus sp. URHD0036]